MHQKKHKSIRKLFLGFLVTFIGVIIIQILSVSNLLVSAQNPPKHEFRAIWITTLNNMDWPSKKGLSIEEIKAEYIKILDNCVEANLNAVIVQVRPSGDSFYKSNYEPWSEWLMGEQGKAPENGFDPLTFMLEETHKRNMEFHAWLNPLRAVYHTRFSNIHESHIVNRKPQWFLTYGSMKIFNPGIPEVREYLIGLCEDLVSRYDIDGLHFDDYFYPYPQPDMKLKDDAQYWKYKGDSKDKDEWRRNNISQLVMDINTATKAVNPKLKFGISPAGVWRNIYDSPLGSHTRGGVTSYDHLNADIRLWLEKGWIDYVAPQVYFSTKLKSVNYRTLIRWWDKNSFGRHLYIGHAAFKVYWDSDKSWYDKTEIPKQITYNRRFKNIQGSVFFRAKNFLRNRGNFRDSLANFYYRTPALVPPMTWLDDISPNSPENFKLKIEGLHASLTWTKPAEAEDGDCVYKYALYKIPNDTNPEDGIQNPENLMTIIPAQDTSFVIKEIELVEKYSFVLTSLDRMNNESKPAIPEKEELLVLGKYTIKEFQYLYQHFNKGINNHFGWLFSSF
ncbi:glycoside hydrolase family 10 protein [Flexithrix dorotheae]|uniref:glycoside hydrolase family 10 protein n=1 Tax=Flexithrix dorotheae TaxID=70993 RepID=UPI0003613614|nr:family 10 glycosylhydrolase [Flexithrix dorotheae]